MDDRKQNQEDALLEQILKETAQDTPPKREVRKESAAAIPKIRKGNAR